MPMYNLIEYSDNYLKTSGSPWQYCKEIPAVNDNGAIVNFYGANSTESFHFKTKITGQTNDDGNLYLYVPVVTLSTQDNSKLLPQLKNGLKRAIN